MNISIELGKIIFIIVFIIMGILAIINAGQYMSDDPVAAIINGFLGACLILGSTILAAIS